MHLLGFGMLAALIIMLVKGPPTDGQNMARVTFTAADVAQVQARFERTWSRPPTAADLQKAFELYVRTEVLYREALARGLDRNDPVVRMSLVRKITILGATLAQNANPSDEELQAYFELRAERYRIPASFSLMQVYLNRDKNPGSFESDAARLLEELREQNPSRANVSGFGDRSLLPELVTNARTDEIASTFGEEFLDAVVSLPVGQWTGPVESTFGMHLVKITGRVDSRIPKWVEVRNSIEADLLYEGRAAAEDQFYTEVLPRYDVYYDAGAVAALAGPGRLTPAPDRE